MMMAMVTVARVMAASMRVLGKGQQGQTTATTVAVMRVASNKEGEGSKAMEMVTRLAGKQRRC